MFKIHVYWKNGRRIVKEDFFFSYSGEIKNALKEAFKLFGKVDSVWVQPYGTCLKTALPCSSVEDCPYNI